ncbi:GNAT family N-acetyltransferase [Aureivirga sp. CE67]|uniref:GNAT family N-acetyltransferase n=1 Tax=Aureivirga sp. CE67 TaxID=1788983 RepID=UPI0018C98D27|nr:GNAT family N-acetyltransferase [Aureivirga sp. CE67]
MKPIIETKRLILREFSKEDVEAVYEFNSNDEIHKYTGDEIIKTTKRAQEIIEQIWLKDYEKYGYGRWAVIYKPDNKIIGFAGLKFLPEINETDIGYRFLPKYWGMGIASEVSEKILEYGFKNLNLKRIIGIAMPENIGSWKVLEKIGLSFYKIDEYDGDGKKYNWYQIYKETFYKINE